MLLNSTFSEPIIIAHPRTGCPINVAPIFDVIDRVGGETSTPADLCHIVEQTIFTIAITVHDPQVTSPQNLANLNQDLLRLYEMFGQMIA